MEEFLTFEERQAAVYLKKKAGADSMKKQFKRGVDFVTKALSARRPRVKK